MSRLVLAAARADVPGLSPHRPRDLACADVPIRPTRRYAGTDAGRRALHTSIWMPQGYTGPLAIIFKRTPYGIDGAGVQLNAQQSSLRELAADGYAFAFRNSREVRSEGEFVMQRPPRDRRDPKPIDEGSDT